MCVAAVIFEPVSMEYLTAMEDDNPHGAGVAWLQDGRIRFARGLTAADIFQMQSDNVMSYPYLMHYRWATHGEKIPELTHPFPLGPRALMGELHGSASAVLIHNGTWSAYETNATKFVNEGNYELPEEVLACGSDTAIAAYLALHDQDILDSVQWATAVAEIKEIDGKTTMEITTRGSWYEKESNWYSNLNWVPGNYYSFGAGYSLTNNDEKYRQWEAEYYGTTPNDQSLDNIDWDAYFMNPYSTRSEAEKHLSFDDFVERYRKPPPKAVEAGPPSRAELSWDEYLVAKYGAKVAAQIKADCFPEDGADSGDAGLALTCAYHPSAEDDAPHIDADTVSEDFETVNSILARQSAMNFLKG